MFWIWFMLRGLKRFCIIRVLVFIMVVVFWCICVIGYCFRRGSLG